MSHGSLPHRNCGFTIVELLVVISIVSLLIAILVPALARARDMALTIKCASNEKQVLTSLFGYAADNYNYLPHATWRATLIEEDYLPGNEVIGDTTGSTNFRCPVDEERRPSNDRFQARASYAGSIGWKPTTDPNLTPQTPPERLGMFPPHSMGDFVRLDDAKAPTETIIFVELFGFTNYLRYRSTGWQDSGSRTRGWSTYTQHTVIHDDKANFAFTDGHVKLMQWTATYKVGVFNKFAVQGTGDRDMWNRQ